MSDEKIYSMAEKRVDDKISFYRHLYSFIIANVFLIIINVVFFKGSWWFIWITGIWALALLIHFLKTFVLVDNFDGKRDSMIEDEIKKMKK